MIDKTRLHLILNDYKKDFSKLFWTNKTQNEKYKWVAVKHFQDNWDIDADDFFGNVYTSNSENGKSVSCNELFPSRNDNRVLQGCS